MLKQLTSQLKLSKVWFRNTIIICIRSTVTLQVQMSSVLIQIKGSHGLEVMSGTQKVQYQLRASEKFALFC